MRIRRTNSRILLIRPCAGMEDLLLNFQADLGTISAEIKTLQEQSLSMSIRLRNRKAVEKTLGSFLEDIAIAPNLIDGIYESDITEEYLSYLTKLDRKLEFIDGDEKAKTSRAVSEVKPELEKLRIKAVNKVMMAAHEYILFLLLSRSAFFF